MNIFITGTDTDAGKTTVSAWICSQIRTTYWKLIQTGDDSDSEIIRKFAPHTKIIPEIYKLKAPLSAYDASKLENFSIDTEKIRTDSDKMIIEGAGGVFVPIAKNFTMINAIKQTNSKALVVVRSKLGMINHILLTVFALKNYNIPILGIIVSGDIQNNIKETIENFSGEKIIAILNENKNLEKLFKQIPLPQEITEILK